jgi:hypothetical protein
MGTGSLRVLAGALLGILLLAACPTEGNGNLPYLVPAIPPKNVENPDESINSVRALCYVDTELYNPLNAGDYVLQSAGTLFFDYVVLGAAQIKFDKNRGPQLYLPPNLAHVLGNRKTYIKPLQMKGIKVLLGITGGGDNYSFGSLTTDEAHAFTEEIMGLLTHYGLDGIELNDENAGASGVPFYPDELRAAGLLEDVEIDFDHDGDIDDDDDEAAAWYYGGDMMCNLTYYLRLEFEKEINQKGLIIREVNFGRYFPSLVSGSMDEAAFQGSSRQINYVVNPYFYRFVSDSAQREPGSDDPVFSRNKHTPFIVDLGGDPASTADRVVPTLNPPSSPPDPGDLLNPGSIFDFNDWFINGGVPGDPYESGRCDYGLLYYYNLKAVSEAAAEDYLAHPTDGKITQAEYMSLTARTLFADNVVLAPGVHGDHLKDW